MVDITDALIHALVRRGVKIFHGVPGDFLLASFNASKIAQKSKSCAQPVTVRRESRKP
jgi:hypothetical protein